MCGISGGCSHAGLATLTFRESSQIMICSLNFQEQELFEVFHGNVFLMTFGRLNRVIIFVLLTIKAGETIADATAAVMKALRRCNAVFLP